MTLIIAIGCTDGVVLASDSATTNLVTGTKQAAGKLYTIDGQSIIYGGSGDVGLQQKIEDGLESFTQKRTLRKTRHALKNIIVPELREALENYVPIPNQQVIPPVASMIFAGVLDGEPWVVEIDQNGTDTKYDERLGHFIAIGSGSPWAQAVFRPHLETERDVRLGKIFACRVVEDSIDLAAAYLARPVHMSIVSLDGSIHILDEDELQHLSIICEGWRELVRETVPEMLASQAGKRKDKHETFPKPNDEA